MKIQLYVLRQLVVALLIAAGGISFLVFPAIAVKAVNMVGGTSLPMLFTFVAMLGVKLIPYLLPMAFLLSVVAVFGRIASDNEWTAIRMSGFQPARVLSPGLLIAVLLTTGTGWLLHEVAPDWNFRQRAFGRRASQLAFKTLARSRTEINIGDFYLHAKAREGTTFRRVLVYLPRASQDLKIVADAAKFTLLEDSVVIAFENARVVKGPTEFLVERPVIQLSLSELLDARAIRRSAPKYLRTSELVAQKDTAAPARVREIRFEIQWRNALAASYLVFLLLGFPTGIWLRRGSQLSALAAAVGYGFVYYVVSMRLSASLVEVELVPPEVAAWAMNVLGAAAGLAMTWHALRR